MIYFWLVILVVCFVLLILLSIFLYYTLFAGLFFAPYLPTSGRDIEAILDFAKLKKGQQFIDLGSGDGKVVIEAVKKYNVNGTGIEINPLLIFFSRLKSRFLKLASIEFLRTDLYSFPLNNAHVVYLFLMPRMMDKMALKVKQECGKGTLIISRGFELPNFKKIHEIETKPFPTYFYRV
jgi:hypothetical protein